MRSAGAERRGNRGASAPPRQTTEPTADTVGGDGNSSRTRGAAATDVISEEDEVRMEDTSETIEETHARLIGLVRAQRQAREIRAMELELAGETPAHPVLIEGTMPFQSKRPASQVLEPEMARRSGFLKPSTLPMFSGKDLKELRDFSTAWSLHLRTPGAPQAHQE